MDVEYRSVHTDSGSTYYLEAGHASGTAVLLVHDGAFGSDAYSCWGRLIPLLDVRHRILAPDLLGYGRSPKVYDFTTDPMAQRIRQLQAFVEALGIGRAAFVGNSFGGGMVLRAAVSRALEMHCAVSICGTGGIFMRQEQYAVLRALEPTYEGARRVEETLQVSPSEAEVKRRHAASLAPGHWETLAATKLRNPGSPPATDDWEPAYRDALGDLDMPVMIVAGGDDPLLEDGWDAEMAKLIRQARVVRIPSARHAPQVDHPQAVAEVVGAFLGEHAG